MQPLLS